MIGEVRNWEEENIRLLCSTVAPWPDARAKKNRTLLKPDCLLWPLPLITGKVSQRFHCPE